MFSDPVSFSGDTRVEVIAVLANCGRDTDRARRALVTWIRRKQAKGRSTEHILVKLRDIESKFIKDVTLHSAFRDARAETFLPRAPDLPLPDSVRRRSTPDAAHSNIASPQNNPGFNPTSSYPSDLTRMTSVSTSPSRFSYSSSESASGRTNTSRAPSHARNAQPHMSPRIRIPGNRPLRPGLESPLTSSPEDSGHHLRYRYMSEPVAPTSQYYGLPTPPSASPPESSFSFPSPRPYASRPKSVKKAPHSSDDRPRPSSHPVSPTTIRRRVTPPATCPPDLPLPPVPSDSQGIDSDVDIPTNGRLAKQPPTPVRSVYDYSATPVRPLPIQPIPSPVPDSDESENADTIGTNSLLQRWPEVSREALHDVVRQDSPMFVLHDSHASQTGISPPPPYVEPLDTYAPPDIPTIGERLDRAVDICGGSPEVLLEVSKCIKFNRGYEPPYWQSRLQACGLNEAAAKYLVDEMCKEVDWATSFSRVP